MEENSVQSGRSIVKGEVSGDGGLNLTFFGKGGHGVWAGIGGCLQIAQDKENKNNKS